MSSNNFGFSQNGFVMPTIEDVRNSLISDAQSFAPQISFEDSSKLETAYMNLLTTQFYCLWQAQLNSHNSNNPNFLNGCQLDIYGRRFGIPRLDNENDSVYRFRILSITSGSGNLSGDKCFDRLYSSLADLNGVTDIQVNLNDTGNQVGFLPPRSYEVMVLGGNDADVAELIWNNHPVGLTLVGNNSFTITDCSGVCRPVYFTRPKVVPVFLDFYLKRTSLDCGCPTNDTGVIKDSLARFIESSGGLCLSRIGKNISIEDFFPALYAVRGIGVNEAYISRDGLCANQEIVALKRDEIPFFSSDCCNFSFESGPAQKAENLECNLAQTDSEASDYCYRCPPPECTFTLDITKVADKTEFTSIGEIITYTYTVTNTGVSTLLNPITIIDDKATVTCADFPITGLPVGESITCTALYETTLEDAVEGGVTNKAQASAGDIFSMCVEAFVEYSGPDLFASMLLEKTLVEGSCTALGNSLVYQYVITNTGNVPITTDPVVIDDKISGIICSPIPAGGLLPNDSVSATAQTPVTQQMLDDGECCNNARASASSLIGNIVSNVATYCVECSESTVNIPPTAPEDYLIQDCDNEFPYDVGLWTSTSGSISLSANGTDIPLGLLFSDNGDNTGTITVTGPINNGAIAITGTDSLGETSVQVITVNCLIVNESGSVTDPNPITPFVDVLDLNGDIQVSTDLNFFNSGVGPISACGSSINGGNINKTTHSNNIPDEYYITLSSNPSGVTFSSVTFSSSCEPDITLNNITSGSQQVISQSQWQSIRAHLTCPAVSGGYTLEVNC